ncbi:DUF4304 domain-containing protein [Mesorhizobium huakuii]|uniref:DUF4304 domain-containing protein n=1 Tax=Mesorhizobium huakuii TaxID=28104 RepID=A0ABZ0VW79_9HYPH|nr:DUF4304 domain-containing protein [Mesorhizobium huakuii]WQC01536.1 DUF4304 domain-containing protein [Mesorhizobium huakuii]
MDREPPRQVFLDACCEISSRLKPVGFRFAKSGPHASRRAGDWTFRISFQSNYLNVGGEYVELVVHVSVHNKAIREWDERNGWPANASDWVAGGQLGNLLTPYHWRTWSIANPLTRQAEITNIVANIQATVLPVFERFGTPRELAEQVAETEIPGFMLPEHAVRFVFWQLGRVAAENCMSYWVARLPSPDIFRSERDVPTLPDRLALGSDANNLARVARAMKIGLSL